MAFCGGSCASCPGCPSPGTLELTRPEIDFLLSLAQIPFQPVVREVGNADPIYPGGTQQTAQVLRMLERKGLISADYSRPLAGYSDPVYQSYPIRGSIALTARGQQVLDLLDYQGAVPEESPGISDK